MWVSKQQIAPKFLAHKLLVCFLVLFAFSTVSQAQEMSGAKAGLVFGYSVPDAQNTRPLQTWGITGTANLTPKYSFGGYYLISDKRQGRGGRDFNYSIHGLSANYHVLSGRGDTFFGIRAGITKVETLEGTDRVIFSPYHVGVSSGYDYTLFTNLSAGFEGSYLRFNKSETTVDGTTYNEGSFQAISFAVTLKFRF